MISKKEQNQKSRKGFFAFNKAKIILAILLELPLVLSFLYTTNKILYYVYYLLYFYYPPIFISGFILTVLERIGLGMTTIEQLALIIILISSAIYVYLLSCIIIFIYNKLRGRKWQ